MFVGAVPRSTGYPQLSSWRTLFFCQLPVNVKLSSLLTAYLEYIHKSDANVEDDINPNQDVDQIVEQVPSMRYKDCHILQ